MSDNYWKSAIELIPIEFLIQFKELNGVKISIPGFRTIDPTNKIVWLKLIQELVKPKQKEKILTELKRKVENDITLMEYLKLDREELLSKIQAGESFKEVIFALLSDQSDDAHKKLLYILNKIQHKSKKTSMESERSKENADNSDKKLNEEIKKRMKLEQKVIEFQSKLNQLRQEYDGEKNKLKAQSSKQEALIKQYKLEIKQLETQNNELLGKCDKLQSKNNDLMIELENLSNTIKERESLEINVNQNDEINKAEELPKVVLIGNPMNSFISKNVTYDIQIIEPEHLEIDTHKPILEQSQQVWILAYRINRKHQEKVNKCIPTNKQIHRFADFHSLQNYIKNMSRR
ncbi:hypothetical protein [Brevibacillus sp. MS2.2]|uniref:hypothetical protein n=1 Tax=Brevibacillus sp. MS2.2 TaxID=2738981 RepID=UPI00156B18D7|nr:hypothetical protein [Brevibacillus sp. MS2.2]NRR23659.1 hypothetical protein [Brevibacillus sp. MS2.2]